MEATLGLRQGLYFEDFTEGLRVVSAARTITETDIVNFAGMTGDWTNLHTDAEFAKSNMFGQRIAHGLLILSIASGLAIRLGFMEGTVLAFLGVDEWKFKAPVFIGDTIHVEAEVVSSRELHRLGGGIVTLGVSVLNQKGEAVQHGKWNVLVKGRPQEESGDNGGK